jgi:hypothetical protein
MSITYSEFMSVVLVIQHAMRVHHFVICGLPRSTKIFTVPHKRHVFPKYVTENKICALIFFIKFFWNISR